MSIEKTASFYLPMRPQLAVAVVKMARVALEAELKALEPEIDRVTLMRTQGRPSVSLQTNGIQMRNIPLTDHGERSTIELNVYEQALMAASKKANLAGFQYHISGPLPKPKTDEELEELRGYGQW